MKKSQKSKVKSQNCNLKVFGFKFLLVVLPFYFLLLPFTYAQESSSSELITKAWAAQGERKFEEVQKYTQQCVDLYKPQADIQHKALKDYPAKPQEPLSDVATAYFIQAEALMRQEKLKEAKEKFEFVIKHYRYAVAWDPSRGVYWKVAGVARESADKINETLSGQGKETKEPV